MGLSAHELILVLRARDEASRVLRGFADNMRGIDKETARQANAQFHRGSALATAGVAVAAAGVAGAVALNDMTNAAAAYNQQAALTLTQVDKTNVSFDELSAMGLRIAKTMPVAFEQIQPALYDIFSSIDVNAPQAEMLLRNIGKAAVGGSVDMETAGRATVAVLNAYKMKAEDVTAVNDIMFQLVRKGVGTYQQFTAVIGRSIPSAIRAGQSFQTLAGMMAFMTRNGMSTAQATTSAARALDALSNPKTIKNFKAWGVNVVDAKGKFRPLVNVIEEMRDKLSKLSPAARSAKLQELFKGSGGTIQAMRFFNLAVTDSNKLLPEMVKDMNNAKGAADQAYKVMANTPQAKIQEMNNKYQVMKVTIGNDLLPVKLKLAEAVTKLLDAFNKLSPSTQKNIAIAAALVSGFLILTGVVLAIAGTFLMFSAAAMMAGTTVGAILLPIGLVIALLAVLAAGVYYVIKHWDEMKGEATTAWNWIKKIVTDATTAVVDWVNNAWNNVKTWTSNAWNAIAGFFTDVWNRITGAVSAGVNWVNGIIQSGINFVKGIWNAYWGSSFGQLVIAVFNLIKAAVQLGIAAIMFVIRLGVNFISQSWSIAWNFIKAVVMTTWAFIKGFIAAQIAFVRNNISAGVNGIKNAWASNWGGIRGIITGVWNFIVSFVKGQINMVRTAIQVAWTFIKTETTGTWNAFKKLISDNIHTAMGYVTGIRKTVGDALNGARTWLLNAGADIINGLIDGITSKVKVLTDKLKSITKLIPKNKGPKAVDLKLLFKSGQYIMQGLMDGIEGSRAQLISKLHSISNTIAAGINKAHAIGDRKGMAKLQSLKSWTDARIKTMTSYANRHQSIVDKIAATTKKLADLNAAKAAYAANVTSTFNKLGDLGQFTSTDNPATATDMIAKLQENLTLIKNFQATITQLKKQGMSQGGIDQILQAGPEVGSQIGQSILNGGPAAIKQINDLQSQISKASTGLGNTAASQMYDAGIAAATGLLKGLQSQKKALEAQMKALAMSMVNTIKAALGIHSPSRVLRGLGVNTIQGYRKGLGDQQAALVRDAVRLGNTVTTYMTPTTDFAPVDFGPRGPGRPGGGYGPGGDTIVNFHEGAIQTQEIDPKKHAADLGWEFASKVRA